MARTDVVESKEPEKFTIPAPPLAALVWKTAVA
jgi:hypothetical protein